MQAKSVAMIPMKATAAAKIPMKANGVSKKIPMKTTPAKSCKMVGKTKAMKLVLKLAAKGVRSGTPASPTAMALVQHPTTPRPGPPAPSRFSRPVPALPAPARLAHPAFVPPPPTCAAPATGPTQPARRAPARRQPPDPATDRVLPPPDRSPRAPLPPSAPRPPLGFPLGSCSVRRLQARRGALWSRRKIELKMDFSAAILVNFLNPLEMNTPRLR